MANLWLDVSDTTPRIAYIATAGQTAFTVPFVFFSEDTLRVYKNAVLLTLSTDYTVSGDADFPSGTVTLLTGAALADEIMIVRDVPIEQTTHIPPSGPLDIPAINIQISKLVAMIQQVVSFFTRAIHFPDSDSTSSGELAAPAARANKLLGFGTAGELIYPSGTAYVGDTTTGIANVDSRSTLQVTTFAISVNRIITGGFLVPSDAGAGAAYKRGTAGGPMAVQDGGGVWWELDLSGGVVYGAWCGIKGDGVDDTAAFAATRLAARTNGLPIKLPSGHIRLTADFLFDWHQAMIEGVAGTRDTRIYFDPASDNLTCLSFYKAGDSNGLTLGSLKNLAVYRIGSRPGTAVRIINTSKFTLEDVNIQNAGTIGTSFIAMVNSGRELTVIKNCTLVGDLPLEHTKNPERAGFLNSDEDFFRITDSQLIVNGTTFPNMQFDDGVQVTEFLMDNVSMNGGTAGVSWNDSTGAESSGNFTARNCRFEQGTAGSVMFLINRTASKLHRFTIQDCRTVFPVLYGRGITSTTIMGQQFEGVGITAIDLDGASCDTLSLVGNFWGAGTLANLASFAIVYGTSRLAGPSPSPLPTTGELVTTRFPYGKGIQRGSKSANGQQGQEWMDTFTLANTASLNLDPFAFFAVEHAFIEVSCTNREGGTALFNTSGLTKLSGSTNFSTTSTVGTLCVSYTSAVAISIVNNLGSSQEITVRIDFSSS